VRQTDIAHLNTFDELGGSQVLVRQLMSPVAEIQEIAALLVRHTAAIGTVLIPSPHRFPLQFSRSCASLLRHY
jgi:hypothetical protein